MTDSGSISYQVQAVKISGYAMNKDSLMQSMNMVCPKMETLLKTMLDQHNTTKHTKFYGPTETRLTEIDLYDVVTTSHYAQLVQDRKVHENQTRDQSKTFDF